MVGNDLMHTVGSFDLGYLHKGVISFVQILIRGMKAVISLIAIDLSFLKQSHLIWLL